MQLGLVQWQSHTIPIVQMMLNNGGITATAVGPGPFESYEGGVDLYGVDGFLVGFGGNIVVPAVKEGENLKLNITMSLSSMVLE